MFQLASQSEDALCEHLMRSTNKRIPVLVIAVVSFSLGWASPSDKTRSFEVEFYKGATFTAKQLETLAREARRQEARSATGKLQFKIIVWREKKTLAFRRFPVDSHMCFQSSVHRIEPSGRMR